EILEKAIDLSQQWTFYTLRELARAASMNDGEQAAQSLRQAAQLCLAAGDESGVRYGVQLLYEALRQVEAPSVAGEVAVELLHALIHRTLVERNPSYVQAGLALASTLPPLPQPVA